MTAINRHGHGTWQFCRNNLIQNDMKFLKLLLLFLLGSTLTASAQTSCEDMVVYPMTKNIGATGSYTIKSGYEEKAAQTYYYSGPGSISQVRVYGNLTSGLSIPLNIVIYSVDASGRPKTALKTVSFTWWITYNTAGYRDINVGGVSVNSNFALAVEIPSGTPANRSFAVTINGNSDGRNEDLASIAGTSTGYNWTSAKSTFTVNGDFYILPIMTNFITSGFTVSSQCADVNGTLSFTNASQLSQDSMFNKLSNPKYSGSNYLYTWNFGDNTAVSHAENPTHAYAKAGKYTVTLTTTLEGWGNTCSDVYRKPVSVGLAVNATKITNVSCNGDNTGSFTASATGGAAPYMYSIDGLTYQSTATFSSRKAGNYILYVKDSLGCTRATTLVITEPAAIQALSYTINPATCGSSNGSIILSAKGGTGSLQYSIDGGPYISKGNFMGLRAGYRAITVKDSLGCSQIFYAVVNNLAGPKIKISGYTNVVCHGDANGTITATATGGSGTLMFSLDGINYQPSGSFGKLLAGTYGVMVKDSNGCMDAVQVKLTEPNELHFSVTSSPASCYGAHNGVLTIVNATGGTGSYTASLDGTIYQSSLSFSQLSAGAYTLYLRDAAGCIATYQTSVGQPEQLKTSVTVTNAHCNGSNDGTISISATGGTPPYQYSMDGINFQPTGMFTNLSPDIYNIITRDANGCFYTSTSATITEPNAIAVVFSTTKATCGNSNGAVLATAGGGSGSGYKYSMDGGATFNTSGSFTGLKDSTYELIVTDSKSCSNIFTVIIASTNGPKIGTVNHTDVSCHSGFDGSISVSGVTGGTGAIYYSLDGANWQTSGTFTGLRASKYIVQVKDAVGCLDIAETDIQEPSDIKIITNVTHPQCYESSTGSITVLTAGGIGTPAYSLDGIIFQSSNVFTNLTAGNYNIYVRDAAHCSSRTRVTLVDPQPVTLNYTGILRVSCHGASNASIVALAQGGKGTLRYSLDGANYQASNVFNGLSAGSYALFVKDSNNCTERTIVRITEPAALSLTASIENVPCAGGQNGSIQLTVTGGTPPYTYFWNNLSIAEDLFNLPAGNYSVMVVDNSGCSMTATYTVTEPDQPILIVNGAVTNSTAGQNNGSIVLTITGGSGTFSYLWSNGATSRDIYNLAPGEYSVVVIDSTGCQVSQTFIVQNKTGLEEANIPNVNVNVYPNPANEMLNIDAGDQQIQQLVITNIQGKLIMNETYNDKKITLYTSTLASGIYVATYKVNGYYYHQRFEIQR
jgi:hypothetical protein